MILIQLSPFYGAGIAVVWLLTIGWCIPWISSQLPYYEKRLLPVTRLRMWAICGACSLLWPIWLALLCLAGNPRLHGWSLSGEKRMRIRK